MPPQAAQSLPTELRVHLKDGRNLTLEHAGVVADSLIGEDHLAVALADIESVEKKRFNVWVTLVVVGIVAGVFVAAGGALWLGDTL